MPKELEELKECEKSQNELITSENKDYTDSIIENKPEEINEIAEPKIGATKKPEISRKKSLADLKIKYEKIKGI